MQFIGIINMLLNDPEMRGGYGYDDVVCYLYRYFVLGDDFRFYRFHDQNVLLSEPVWPDVSAFQSFYRKKIQNV